MNGGDVSEGRNLGAGLVPNLDSVEEFRLITNSFDAEYGKFSGAVMNAITKSGTNGIHGTAFEFLRNDNFDANNFSITRRHRDPMERRLARNCDGTSLAMRSAARFGRTSFSGLRIIKVPAKSGRKYGLRLIAHDSPSATGIFSPASDLSAMPLS